MTEALRAPPRILALDLHPQRYGYAVLEAPELLDWGVRRRYIKSAPRGVHWVNRSLRQLLDRWRPSLIATNRDPKLVTPRLKKIGASVGAEARRFGIPVRCVPEADVRSTLWEGKRLTKYYAAKMLVQRYSYLALSLPPVRKIFESENYRMSIFAAVALALTVIAQKLRRKRDKECDSHKSSI